MSEFACADCGNLMVLGSCPKCGCTRIGTMDGKTNREILAEERIAERRSRIEDIKSEIRLDDEGE